MPLPSQAHLDRVWEVLSGRESTRLHLSQLPPSNRYPSPEQLFYSVSNSLRHRTSNRYSNILAYDRTAVSVEGEYLNANVVCDAHGGWWVASQAPVPGAFHAFFKAIYSRAASKSQSLLGAARGTNQNAAIMVQLTAWEEKGLLKADPYMAMAGKDQAFASKTSPEVLHLHHVSSTPLPGLSSVYSVMKLYAADQALETPSQRANLISGAMDLHHFAFDAWPDHGAPEGEAVEKLRALILEVGKRRQEMGGNACEVWVHCSAGVGRTGAFISLSSLLLPRKQSESSSGSVTLPASPLGPLPPDLSEDHVAATIDGIREWRGWLCQNQDQMRLVYELASRRG